MDEVPLMSATSSFCYSESRFNSNSTRDFPETLLPEKMISTNTSFLCDVRLRFLCPEDIAEVRQLCQDCFPINYPETWYEEITSKTSRFYSLASVHNGCIIGLLVAQIKSFHSVNPEDRDILSINTAKNPYVDVAYILSLGIARPYRRNRVASLLLNAFIDYLSQPEMKSVKAVFLHVLTTNTNAILFYEKNRFQLHNLLPYYYMINSQCRDAFSYVLYINGGRKPFSILNYLAIVKDQLTRPDKMLVRLIKSMRTLFRYFCQHFRRPRHYSQIRHCDEHLA